jgi:lysophospholipase L1-like esterase
MMGRSNYDAPRSQPPVSSFPHQYHPLSPSGGSNGAPPSSFAGSCFNAFMNGRIPLCIILLLILGFIAWHVETDAARRQVELLNLTLTQSEQQMIEHTASMEQLAEGVTINPRQRLPVKASYRCLLVGDSLTVGYYWDQKEHPNHPYLIYLDHLLSMRHPNLKFEFVMEAEGGECVISTCTTKSMLARVTDRLAHVNPDTHEREYFDLAIIMGGTNDIFHDFDAKDVAHGLSSLHKLIWEQAPPVGAHASTAPVSRPKTIALTIPQWGDTDAWRPPKRQSKLHPKVAAAARGFVNQQLIDFSMKEKEQCTLINLDQWFPRHTLAPRELTRKWAENVHPTPFGYDEIGLIVYQHLKHILPQN